MIHFPVTNSNLSATHIGLFLQEKYPLSKDAKCQLIKAGINDTYLVTDNSDKFVFRVYSLNWRTKAEIVSFPFFRATQKYNFQFSIWVLLTLSTKWLSSILEGFSFAICG